MGRLSLSGGLQVYLDANILIHSAEGHPVFMDGVDRITAALDAGRIQGISSELSYAEVLVKPLREKNNHVIAIFDELFRNHAFVEMIPITRPILRIAAELRGTIKVKLPDAIQIATALSRNCRYFATQEERLRMLNGMTRVSLADLDP
jgi:predicted nucleic acid-binding protein